MKTFRFKLHHDQGTTTIKVTARNETAAREMLMRAEGCPDRSISLIK